MQPAVRHRIQPNVVDKINAPLFNIILEYGSQVEHIDYR